MHGKHPTERLERAPQLKEKFFKNRHGRVFTSEYENSKLATHDSRVKIQCKNNYPYCAVGYLTMDFPGTDCFATGVLIKENIVLTSAHNLFSENGEMASEIHFCPGMRGTEATPFQAIRCYFPDEFQRNQNSQRSEWDFAIIELMVGSQFSKHYGYLGLNSQWQGKGENLMLCGYPEDLNATTSSGWGPKYMYGAESDIYTIRGNTLTYDIATDVGQSGSPIIRKNQLGEYQVVGIHCKGDLTLKSNSGVKITQRVRRRINQWVGAISGDLNIRMRIFVLILEELQITNVKELIYRDLTKLETLDIGNNKIGIKGVRGLMASTKVFPDLVGLYIGTPDLTEMIMKSRIKGLGFFSLGIRMSFPA